MKLAVHLGSRSLPGNSSGVIPPTFDIWLISVIVGGSLASFASLCCSRIGAVRNLCLGKLFQLGRLVVRSLLGNEVMVESQIITH